MPFLRRRKQRPDDPDRELARQLTARADQARDAHRYATAAALYEESLQLQPGRTAIHVQAGHMFKEAGDFSAAERHYRAAEEQTPGDPDLALQLGHFLKLAGRLGDAERAYRRASELAPGWEAPVAELRALDAAGWRVGGAGDPGEAVRRRIDDLRSPARAGRALPEVRPLTPDELVQRHGESIHIRRLGRRERTPWGEMPVLRGVVAVRGVCLSEQPILECQVLIRGLAVHRGPVECYEIANEAANARLRKYVFNAWIDVSTFARGLYDLTLRFIDPWGDMEHAQGRRWVTERVLIADPLHEAERDPSDALVPITDPSDPRTVMEQVNARPSMVRPARREAFPKPPERVLVIRTDQLGDVVASVPALRRLRELLPQAQIVGLVTAANKDLAATLGLFDDLVIADFPDDPVQRKRVMTLEEQDRLREVLGAYRFDLAIDLAPARESRPMLLLSGAPFLFGMGQWPWLTTSFEIQSRDPVNHLDFIPHSTKPLALVETLGALLRNRPEPVRRADLVRELLVPLGVAPDCDFAVLHTGARIAFSRWHGYPELAERLIAETNFKIVMLTDDPGLGGRLSPSLLESERFVLLDRRLAFDELDALLSFARLFVGNDSGPKHLASLRGTAVVGVHSARINWGEWAQEHGGLVVSRKVPCAGCLLYHDTEECGADYACVTRIRVDEVFDAAKRLLAGSAA